MGYAAVILAAGGSTRFGSPKQLAEFGGTSLLLRAIQTACEAGCAPVAVVVGAEAERMTTVVAAAGATAVFNPDWSRGLGTSVRAGVRALPKNDSASGVILMACDQPLVRAELLRSLIAAARPIAASSYSGTLGIPAAFAREMFDQLLALRDDEGAKGLLTHAAAVPAPEAAEDIDTPAQLDDLRRVAPR